jgi:uncharacterized membrane protein YoaK (UPF0700 family)
MTESDRPDLWLTLGLALVGGYGDAAGFVLSRTFTGHVTGSLVLGAIAVASGEWRSAITHLSAVVTFLVGVLLGALAVRSAKWPAEGPLLRTLAIEVILIVAASLALAHHLARGREIFVVCLSLGLGMQNGAFRNTGGISVHTTYLTGLITGLITTEIGQPPTSLDHSFKPLDQRAMLLSGVWIAFFVGAFAGAALAFRFDGYGLLGAVLILSAIITQRGLARS